MKKKKTSIFFKLLGVLFLVYVALIIAYKSGYYETRANSKALMTKEAMAKFEDDLRNGEIVELKDYLKEEKVDYSNKVTKIGNKFSEGLSELMTNLVDKT